MKYKCQENEGTYIEFDSEDGELMFTVYNKPDIALTFVCLSQEDSEKFKAEVNRSI